jgi:hypothetical protein
MSVTTGTGFYGTPAVDAFRKATPDKYVSLGDFIDEINKPDNRDQLVKSFGAQTITGFLQMTGAVKAQGVADEVQWWEEARLHATQKTGTATIASAAAGAAQTLPLASSATVNLRLNDILMLPGGNRVFVTAVTATGATPQATVVNLKNASLPSAAANLTLPIVGNLYAQGTDQPTEYLESNVLKRTNPYMIVKEAYKVTGSQATNIGWVEVAPGDYRWFMKGEMDTRQRFVDKRELMMLLGQKVTNTATSTAFSSAGIAGSEGYFEAVENRGLIQGGRIATLSDLDGIIKELDRQGAGPEYAMYVDRTQDFNIDDLIAAGIGSSLTSGVATQFGAFNNSADMAVALGFKSFSRGGYTFHKHSWKLLNDPTMLGIENGATELSPYAGVMIPLSTVVDAKTGDRNPSLEINYKASQGYSREMEHWLTGSILGATNATSDLVQFNYRSEIALVTRAANRHVVIRKS